jgi:hypothetical protein
LDELPYPILSLLGNHENFDRIYRLPLEPAYGGTAYRVSQNVYFLRHGESYLIDDRLFFAFGGGLSFDRDRRIPGESWWEQEIPNDSDYLRAKETIARHQGRFDFVLSHTAPTEIVRRVLQLKNFQDYDLNDPTEKMLSDFSTQIECNAWFFGHFHDDLSFTFSARRYELLYEGVVYV